MPVRSGTAPRIAAWQRGNRNLPGPLRGGSPPGGVPFLDGQGLVGYTFGARIYPGADTTIDPSGWTPVDISAHILQPGDGSMPAITIQRARLGEQQQTAPAQMTVILRNDPARGNGDYSPRRATGRYYPYMRAGLPIDAFICDGQATNVRFAGKVEDLTPGWDETGNYAVVVVTAYGTLYDIQQTTTPLRSPLYRTLSRYTTGQVAYWPLEDGADATTAASQVTGVAPMRVGGAGTVTLGAAGAGGAAALADCTGGGTLYGVPAFGQASDQWGVAVSFQVVDTSNTKSAYPLFVQTSTVAGALLYTWTGTAAGVTWSYNTGALTGSINLVLDSTWTLGSFHTVIVYTFNAGGGQVGFGFVVDDVDTGTFWGAAYTGSPGALRRIDVNPDSGDFNAAALSYDSSLVAQTVIAGHVKAWQPYTAVAVGLAGSGFAGEIPSDRLARVCAEEHIPFALPAGPSSAQRQMGAQQADTLANIFRDCETVDGGVLEDGYNFGLALWPVESRYNQTPAFTPTLQQLQPPLVPVENTLRIRNDLTATQPNGSWARYQQPAGQPYAATGPGGIGGRGFPVTVNIRDPLLLPNAAAWLVHLGTVDADRYAPLAVNLAARTGLIPSWLALTNGNRWTVSSTYPTGGLPPDVLVEGWTEGFGRLCYVIAANTAPSDPWWVTTVDDAMYGVVDSDNTTLATWGLGTASTGAVTINVGTLWSVAAGDYPLDFDIAGERVTGTITGGSSPQTLTVSARSVNGVVKDHQAGETVALWFTTVVGA